MTGGVGVCDSVGGGGGDTVSGFTADADAEAVGLLAALDTVLFETELVPPDCILSGPLASRRTCTPAWTGAGGKVAAAVAMVVLAAEG